MINLTKVFLQASGVKLDRTTEKATILQLKRERGRQRREKESGEREKFNKHHV